MAALLSNLNLRERIRKALPTSQVLKVMSISTFINTFGNGLFFTVEIIFLTRSVGLTPHQVGFGFTLAALCAFPMSVPAGQIAHRINIRKFVAVSQTIQGIAAASFIFIHSYSAFLMLTISVEILVSFTQTFRMVLINQVGGAGEARVGFRAYQRAVTNLGIGMGTAFAGIALIIDTRAGYATIVVLNGITFIVAALVFLKVPYTGAEKIDEEPRTGSRFIAIKDKKYVSAMLLNAIYSSHFIIQGVALPLWIIRYTKAPHWTISVVFLINTIACVLFSVRASKGTSNVVVASKVFFKSGLYVAAACVSYALAQGASVWVACGLLFFGMGLHTAGELLGSAAGWGLGFGLADERYQGQYQGVWQMSWSLGGIAGPALITAAVVDLHKAGWLILGAVFIIATFLFIPLVNSMKNRHHSHLA